MEILDVTQLGKFKAKPNVDDANDNDDDDNDKEQQANANNRIGISQHQPIVLLDFDKFDPRCRFLCYGILAFGNLKPMSKCHLSILIDYSIDETNEILLKLMKKKIFNVKTKSKSFDGGIQFHREIFKHLLLFRTKNDNFQSDEMKMAKSGSQKLYFLRFQFAKFHASSKNHQCFIGNMIENGADDLLKLILNDLLRSGDKKVLFELCSQPDRQGNMAFNLLIDSKLELACGVVDNLLHWNSKKNSSQRNDLWIESILIDCLHRLSTTIEAKCHDSALHVAASKDQWMLIECLLETSSDSSKVDVENFKRETALVEGVRNQCEKSVEILLKFGANPNGRPLFEATRMKNGRILKILLTKSSTSINVDRLHPDLGVSPLVLAILIGNQINAVQMIDFGARLDPTTNDIGFHCLTIAVLLGEKLVVDKINEKSGISNGAKFHLDHICLQRVEMMKVKCCHGIHWPSECSKLFEAIMIADCDEIFQILDSTSVNKCQEMIKLVGLTAATRHCKDSLKVIEAMLERYRFDLNLVDGRHCSILMHAAINGRVSLCDFLIQHNCDVTIVDSNGLTAFHLAAKFDQALTGEKLLRNPNNDPLARDGKGLTGLHWAAQCNAASFIRGIFNSETFLPIGFIDATDDTGKTALTLAALEGNVEAIEALFSHRNLQPDTTIVDKEGLDVYQHLDKIKAWPTSKLIRQLSTETSGKVS